LRNRYIQRRSVRHNLQSLYGVKQAPCDTYLRERLDEVEPKELQKNINRIIAQLQHGKILEQFCYFNDYCLVSIDGTGYFNSQEIHCESCCEQHHRDGRITYYHQKFHYIITAKKSDLQYLFEFYPASEKGGVKTVKGLNAWLKTRTWRAPL
jgi:hypothetical protein